MTIFSITGLTFATRDRVGYGGGDDIEVRIIDAANGDALVASGFLEAIGGGLNSDSLEGGGVFSDTISFSPISGFQTSTDFQVEFVIAGGWGNPDEGFWLSLDSAELVANYVTPEPSQGLLLVGATALILLRRQRKK